MPAPTPNWVRQAEEAKLKSEAETAAAAKAAFDATFKALSASAADQDQDDPHKPSSPAQADRDADADSDSNDRHHAPPGPVDPSKSSAAGPGIAGGSAGASATLTVVAKDRDARRVTTGGALVRVRISPTSAVGGDDLDGAAKDNGDGSYAVTYVVPKRGNYMVHVDLDGSPVMGSPFPVFFSASTSATTTFPTILPAITSASPTSTPSAAAHPIVLTPGVAPPPATSSALPTPIPPSHWSLSHTDPALATAASFFSASLSSSATLSLPHFRTLLASFLTTLSHSLSLPPPSPKLPEAIRSLAPYFPTTLASLVASRAARLVEYDVLLALAHSRLLPHPPPDLLSSLSQAGRPDLVCAVLRQAADLRSSELLAALRCFLSPASNDAYDAMVDVKNRWKDAAVLAVNRCGEKGAGKKVNAAAKRAALLLMMGHDGFTSPEVCLHYLFASGDVDTVVLGSAVAELDGEEVVRLMRYLTKWIGKYRRFPEAQACPEAAGMLGLEQCDSVPSFGAVVRALGLVLDEHFSHLVLNTEVWEDLRAAGVMVKELAAEAESSGPILDLLHRLK